MKLYMLFFFVFLLFAASIFVQAQEQEIQPCYEDKAVNSCLLVADLFNQDRQVQKEKIYSDSIDLTTIIIKQPDFLLSMVAKFNDDYSMRFGKDIKFVPIQLKIGKGEKFRISPFKGQGLKFTYYFQSE